MDEIAEPALDCWTTLMAPSVSESLLEDATTRKGWSIVFSCPKPLFPSRTRYAC
jgi:hypothetical protein